LAVGFQPVANGPAGYAKKFGGFNLLFAFQYGLDSKLTESLLSFRRKGTGINLFHE
jgi:hypothetical protein